MSATAARLGLAPPPEAAASWPSRWPLRRLDWIIGTPTLAIAEYRTLPDLVSDHRLVAATVERRSG
jgi:endonuclease/exonuclease/phosphatase family metal-dependent hydrolase